MTPSGASGSEAKTAAEPAAADAADAADAAAGDAPPVVGDWNTVDCGGAAYARELSLMEDNTFEYRDLVSPCPPNARCMWSGVVVRSGTWSSQGLVVTLTPDDKVVGQQAEPVALAEIPSTIGFAHDGLKGSDGCFYRTGRADRGAPMKGERVPNPGPPQK